MIRYDVRESVAHVTIDKPERLNALGAKDMDDLLHCWSRMQEDSNVRVGIISGVGGKAFSAGGDVKDEDTFQLDAGVGAQFWTDPRHSWNSTLEDDFPLWKPVIAAIDGYCLGGGLTLALGADIRICTEQSRFGMPEVGIGINTVTGAALLPRFMNPSLAAQLLLTGESIPARDALTAGLISYVYPDRAALDRAAQDIADAIAKNAPLAVRATKEVMRRGRELPLATVLPLGEAMRGLVRASRDYQEGITAARERRTPEYIGR